MWTYIERRHNSLLQHRRWFQNIFGDISKGRYGSSVIGRRFDRERIRSLATLVDGKPLQWEESIEHLEYVREHGVKQFVNTWKRVKDVQVMNRITNSLSRVLERNAKTRARSFDFVFRFLP